jgi:hypothetical protein
MRFQLFINLGRGAFVADKEVFEKVSSMPPPQVTDDGISAWARGMVYAATLRGPHKATMKGSSGWEVEDYHWGEYEEKKAGDSDDTANLPTFTSDHPRFVADQPITPGWTCSPLTLFLSQYSPTSRPPASSRSSRAARAARRSSPPRCSRRSRSSPPASRWRRRSSATRSTRTSIRRRPRTRCPTPRRARS